MKLVTEAEFLRNLPVLLDYARERRQSVPVQLNDDRIVFLRPIRKFPTVAALELAEAKGSPLIYDVSPQRLAVAHQTAGKYARRL